MSYLCLSKAIIQLHILYIMYSKSKYQLHMMVIWLALPILETLILKNRFDKKIQKIESKGLVANNAANLLI